MNAADICLDGTDGIIHEALDSYRYKTASMFKNLA